MRNPRATRAQSTTRPSRQFTESLPAPKPTASRWTFATIINVSIGFGLVAGLAEVATLLGMNALYGSATLGALQLNRHFTWMVPAVYAFLFGAVGVLLSSLNLSRISWARQAIVTVLGALATYPLVVLIPGLHWAAQVMLACGLGVSIGRFVEKRADRVVRCARVGVPLLVVGVAFIAGLRFWQLAPAEEWAMANLPAARDGAPNVLLIVLDTVRADRLSLYGYPRETTPNLARLASRGTTFDQARSAACWTLPSHASIFTGRWPHELRTFTNRPLDARYPTLAEYFRDHGYATSGFVANTRFCNSWYGLGRGFIHYEDYYESSTVISLDEALRSAELGRRALLLAGAARNVRPGETNRRKDAAQINQTFLDWHAKHGDRPFFTFLNYYDAHDPYIVPPTATRRFGVTPEKPADFRLLNSPHVNTKLASGRGVTERDIALVNDAYDDCLAYLDEQLGKLFDELERRGTLDKTIVVLTSDHGEHLGEHRIYGHGQSLYRPEIHVPLLVVHPKNVPAATRIPEPVTLRDVAATITDRAGLSDGSPFPGRTLASQWGDDSDGSASDEDVILSESIRGAEPVKGERWPPAVRGPMYSLVANGQTYIHNGDGAEELYDHNTDPAEGNDLSANPEYHPDLDRFRELARRLFPDGYATH